MTGQNQGQDPNQNQQQQGAEPPQGAQGTQGAQEPNGSKNKGAEPPIIDSHGQPGINKERHDREIAEKDAKIAELEAQIGEMTKTEEGRAQGLGRRLPIDGKGGSRHGTGA